MVLLNSLLEMKHNDNIVKRLIRSLPIEILKRNIVDSYKRYKKLYGVELINDALKHVIYFIHMKIIYY